MDCTGLHARAKRSTADWVELTVPIERGARPFPGLTMANAKCCASTISRVVDRAAWVAFAGEDAPQQEAA